MATCVPLTDLTDWPLVKIAVKIEKCRQKSSSSKLFQNLFLISTKIQSNSKIWVAESWNSNISYRYSLGHIQNFHCIKVFSGYTADICNFVSLIWLSMYMIFPHILDTYLKTHMILSVQSVKPVFQDNRSQNDSSLRPGKYNID